METKIELKTIHDLPQEIKNMYGIMDDLQNITRPTFVNIDGNYNIEEHPHTYWIRIHKKAMITIYKEFVSMQITIY